MTRLMAVVGVFAIAATAVLGGPPSSPPVEQLIAQLGSELFAEREAASAGLDAAGAAAMPALEAAARDANPEVARRAADVLARLRRITETRERLAPKMIRLAYK